MLICMPTVPALALINCTGNALIASIVKYVSAFLIMSPSLV